MNKALRALLMTMMNQKIIGGRHTNEDKLIKSKTKWLSSKERREFSKEYKEVIKNNIIIRQKKRTMKSSDWHINLNPSKLKQVYEMIYNGSI